MGGGLTCETLKPLLHTETFWLIQTSLAALFLGEVSVKVLDGGQQLHTHTDRN